MINPIEQNRSAPPAPSTDPIKGFAGISELGCSFAVMIKAFANMYEMMQSSGIQEAEVSSGYAKDGVKDSKMKEKLEASLRTKENTTEADMARLQKKMGGDHSKQHKIDQAAYQKDQMHLQKLQAVEGQVKAKIIWS